MILAKRIPVLTSLGLVVALCACNKPRIDDIAPGLEGEWKWTKTREWFNWNGGGADSSTVSAEYDYRIHFNKRRRIEFYKNGECEESKKIVELQESPTGNSFFTSNEGFEKVYYLEIEGEDEVIDLIYKDGWFVAFDWPYGPEGYYTYNHYFKKQ